jgi:hypothetical protein
MNIVRVWILHLASMFAVVFGGSLLYNSYQDLTWYRWAVDADFGPLQPDGTRAHEIPLSALGRIADESANKNREGRSELNAGSLLLSSGLLMDGLASVLRRLEKKSAMPSS